MYCWGLHHSTFILMIDHCSVNWVGKSWSYWHAKSWDFLLTHLLPKKIILFIDLLFQTQLTWQWSFDMIKVLWCRFQHCCDMFTMLLVEGFSQTRFFRHLSDHVFGARNFGKTKSMKVIFFFKLFEIYCRFEKSSKKFRKSFLFLT